MRHSDPLATGQRVGDGGRRKEGGNIKRRGFWCDKNHDHMIFVAAEAAPTNFQPLMHETVRSFACICPVSEV